MVKNDFCTSKVTIILLCKEGDIPIRGLSQAARFEKGTAYQNRSQVLIQ